MIDEAAGKGIAFTPFFPLGGFSPPQSSALEAAAKSPDATPMQVTLAWLFERSPYILLILGTASAAHLRENLKAADLRLPPDMLIGWNAIGASVEPEPR